MIVRQHKTRYFSSESLRQIQAQINELWEVIDRRVEDVDMQPLRPGILDLAYDVDAEGNLTKAAGMHLLGTPGYDPAEQRAMVKAAADPLALPSLNPKLFKVVPTGRGWYQVVDSEGKAIHEGKLRQEAADKAWKKAMQSAA